MVKQPSACSCYSSLNHIGTLDSSLLYSLMAALMATILALYTTLNQTIRVIGRLRMFLEREKVEEAETMEGFSLPGASY